MRDWIPWRLDEPRALARYVLPDVVGEYLHLPGPSGDSPVQRLRAVYAAVAGAGIRYAYEPPSDLPGSQEIRSPAEVLWAPGHATCLDLAITFAAACRKAALDALILLIEREGTGARHALVGVWVQDPPEDVRDELGARTGVWAEQPGWLAGLVRRTADDAGRPLVVLDPVGASTALPSSPARGVHVDFGQAVVNGAARLLEAGWNWQAGVDLARASRERETYQPADRPRVRPLRAPYLDPGSARGPLQLLRADYAIVPFQPRDELTVLRHWCGQAASGRHTGLAVIDGTGGSGKTRLALELAQRLADQGWYAGLLLHSIEGSSWSQSVEWLATVVSPLLVIVDYADARAQDTQTLMRALSARAGPAVVVLTARSIEGEWLSDIQGFVQRDGQILAQRRFALPPEHPDSTAVLRRAAAAFAARQPAGTPDRAPDTEAAIAAPERWTTLDYVLLGWLAARDDGGMPATRRELYEAVLDHEERYWANVYRGLAGTKPSPRVLRRAATCLILRACTPETAGLALQAVPELAGAGEWRENIRRTLAECLHAEPGETLALRPDPIADHLAVTVLSGDPALLDHCLTSLDDEQLAAALANLNRASSTAPDAVTMLFTTWLDHHADRWRPVLLVAAAQAGSALTALETTADKQPPVLPLTDLAHAIPFRHIVLARLGLAIDTRRLHGLRTAPAAEPPDLAELLSRVSTRQSETGDRDGALASSTEAVRIRRALAEASPAAHLPDLAASLNNLSAFQSETGDRDGALASSTEAVRHYRALAEASPAAHLPDLAASLNNLSAFQSGTGDRDGALASSTEAVRIRRALAEASPAAYLPDLAGSLNNLSACQSETGDRDGALASITDAVRIRRALAEASPAAHLPDLAASLNNLSAFQSETGDRDGALASSTEAVRIRRALAEASPAAHLPNLAGSLNNLSNRQSETGDRDGALASITEAVRIRRALAEASPAAHLPDLAMSLNNLSAFQSGTGDRDGALASSTEAVRHYRALAEASPAAYLPNLAGSLNNLSAFQSGTGDRGGALASSTEAVRIRRALAEASPAAYLPDLAMSLNNLSAFQSGTGDRDGALASSTEAVRHYRALAEASPAAHLPNLAASLNNLSNRQSETGDRDGALASSTEAVRHYRALAEASPAAHLPNLAMSLNNLSTCQSGTGDRDGALASITEAVRHYRALAEASPAAYLPKLAASLNNLSACQSGTGGRDGALASSTEAVRHYRALAEASPAAHLPDLAGSLNNLSACQSGTGDRDGALASSTEAVRHYRALAEASPAAHLPNLAGSLNNLSNRQSGTGDRDGALASITEAVRIRRALAEASPAAHLPDLAGSLNNLSNRQSETGDRDGALASSTEAVRHYRALAEASPAAHLPDLAGSLNNLSNRQSGTGDRDGALASSTEAVRHYRALAEASPAAYLPDLARSLNNLARLLGSPLAADEDPWIEVIASLGNSLSSAELRASYARALASGGQRDAAADQLATAATEAGSGDPGSLGRARRAIRQAATGLGTGDPRLPGWVTGPLPDDHIQLINLWAVQQDWPATDAYLTEHAKALHHDDFRASLRVAADLYPDNPAPVSLARLLADIDSRSLDAILADGRTAHADADLLNQWIATPTWQESADFFREHRAELTTPRIRELLAANNEKDEARQHLAILMLSDTQPLDEVYQTVTDTTAARERALDLIESGDLDQLSLILAAAPSIATEGITGAFLQTVIALANGDYDTSHQIAALIAEHGTARQREALAIRLRAFANHQPDQSPVQTVADIIAPDSGENTK